MAKRGWKVAAAALSVGANAGIMAAVNGPARKNKRMVDNMFGGNGSRPDYSNVDCAGLDLDYYKSEYSKEGIKQAEADLSARIAAEGLVLLKNENQALPLSGKGTVSLFSKNAVTVKTHDTLTGGRDLKTLFQNAGMGVNETLWKFYSKGAGKSYGLGKGSVGFGDGEDFRINECPLSVLEDKGVLESVHGTVPVYVLKRVAGEGRDMPRSMYRHTDVLEDKVKSYLEPDSVELEILGYLNDHFSNVVLVVNSNAALELGWLADLPNITSVILAPDGLEALPDVLTGKVNPSGRTVDTFAARTLRSPAAQNFGEYAYYKEDGTQSKYNYVSYAENIYVGYKYYETRYEDIVLKQGNAGDFHYQEEVVYPFGYGLSYTTFRWGRPAVVWNGEECGVSVEVTNSGHVPGKDVVEVYIQSPYTKYDRKHGVEKAAVQLAGYAKTPLLAVGETRKVTVTFAKEQLKAYDADHARTYVLDAGEYFITVARNAHDAVNNVLAAKKRSVDDGMTADGDASMAVSYVPENTKVDKKRYSKDGYGKVEVTNRLDEARGEIRYLSRADWSGTFPGHDGEPMWEISTWGNEINGVTDDGVPTSFVYGKTISDEDLEKLDAFDSGNPADRSDFDDNIVYGKENGRTLVELRGKEYDDPLWEELLDQLTEEEYERTIGVSGYGIEAIESVGMPYCVDGDTASGLIYGGTGRFFPNSMTLAQTWNPGLAYEYGVMIGNEAVLGGLAGWYAPSMNIHRTPYSGRNGEYYSEDAFLSGTVAAKTVLGVASKGVYAYIKHFAFNDQENHRGDRKGQFSIATWLHEQAAREIYLLPFEMCMKAGDVDLAYLKETPDGYENAVKKIRACQAVMTGFNRVGHTWVGGSYALITGIVRNEWDFKGLIITDNANTGVFMDGYQMIEAGADIKLTNLPESARFDFNSRDKAHYYYAREAMHRLLYTVANSKVMNGAMPGVTYKKGKSLMDKIILAVNAACGAGIALAVLSMLIGMLPKKK